MTPPLPPTDPDAEIAAAAAVFGTRPWAQVTPDDLGPARAVPTMLTPAESRFYLWLARDWARGAGEIVDLGCFAGGSTARLAQGLALAGRGGLVHAYDNFTATERVKEQHLYRRGVARFEGRDILPVARALLDPWDGLVTFYRGDIAARRWPGDPIEVLVVDAAKTARLADHIAAEFFAALIPGRSVLVHQDFLHEVQPWLPAQMALLSDHFRPMARILPDCMAFLCTRPVTPDALAAARVADLADADLAALLRRAARWMDGVVSRGRFGAQIRALQRAPGARAAWDLRTRPGTE